MTKKPETIIFDLGGVLIDWNPAYVYRTIFDTEEEVQWFLANICTGDWNETQDGGRSLADGTQLLVNEHPSWEPQIRAFYDRWEEMLGGPIQETVEILAHLKKNFDGPIYALTNWAEETFPVALQKYDFLHWFDGIVVSGVENTRKPFADFYQILFDRYQVDPKTSLFIDDNIHNIKGAAEVHLPAIHFQSPIQLKEALAQRGLLYT